MKIGDFIEWTSQDEEGKFTHVGKVLSVDDNEVELLTKVGTMTVPLDDGSFKKTKPIKLADITEVMAKVKKEIAVAKTGTKLERAVVLYRNMKDATRQKLIKAFVEELDMTPAGASTYAAKVRKIK